MPALALIFHLIDGVDAGPRGPVSRAAAAQAAAWCEYLAAHARRLARGLRRPATRLIGDCGGWPHPP